MSLSQFITDRTQKEAPLHNSSTPVLSSRTLPSSASTSCTRLAIGVGVAGWWLAQVRASDRRCFPATRFDEHGCIISPTLGRNKGPQDANLLDGPSAIFGDTVSARLIHRLNSAANDKPAGLRARCRNMAQSSLLTIHAIAQRQFHVAKSISVLRLYDIRHAVEQRLDILHWC